MSRKTSLATAVVNRIQDNPVIVLDVVKAALTVLIIFGLPIPPGLDVALAGLVFAVLSLFTRSKVTPSRSRYVSHDPDVH